MAILRSICVYCGSSPGTRPSYADAARQIGRDMAGAGIRLIYGGGDVGLMGIIARAVIENGGHVTGIIPHFLQHREQMLTEVEDLIVTDDMHERKRLMFEASDAFVALPGGVGTLEELVEQLTWAQLGQHRKPILLVNVEGFWDRLRDLFEHMHEEGFINRARGVDYAVANRPQDVVPMIRHALGDISPDELDMTVPADIL